MWIDDFLVSNEVPGECTNCNITYAGVQFNTKYFSDFEYGTGGWVPAGGSTMTVQTTNSTSYSGTSSLMLSNSSNLVANFTPGFTSPSVSTATYPFMSFAYKASGGRMSYKIGNNWYNIQNFTADNLWHNVTINLAGYGATITAIAIGNSSATSNTVFYIDDFVISSNRPDNCPYVDVRHDITFHMQALAGWRIDAGSGQAKPDVYIVSTSFNNTTAMAYNDFILVNVTVGNKGNASTGGGQDSIQVDCYLDNILVSTNYTDVLGPAPPVNVSWTNCNFTALTGCHTFNVSTKIIDPPDKEEWNYTNNNESYTVCANPATVALNLTINSSDTTPRSVQYPGAVNVTGWNISQQAANYTLLRNGTVVATGTNVRSIVSEEIQLGVGAYNYTFNMSSDNYTATQKEIILTITKAQVVLYIAVNDSQLSQVYNFTYPNAINVTAWRGSTLYNDGTLTLMRNGSVLSNTSEVWKPHARAYNYTANFSAQNYTATQVDRIVIVGKGAQLTTLQLNGTSADKVYLNLQIAELKAYSNFSQTTTNIYTNYTGSLASIASGTGTVLNYTNISNLVAGNYTVLANTSSNENYSASSSVSYIMTAKTLELNITVEAGGPYASGATVLVIGNTTDVTGVPVQLNVLVEVRKDGVVQTSSTQLSNNDGKYSAQFTDLSTGTYIANVSYGSTMRNDTFSINSTVTVCAQQTLRISGVARDFVTGSAITSGTVTLTIKETEDTKTVNIINGYWSASFNTCLDSGTRYTVGITTRDSSTGKTSYSQTRFTAP
ncbi:MAG: hypothetical protein HZC29_09330 [Thaumarchaeota archaeon]|nr:hypothetical protein [Nitrososphaerota archaeon]